LPNDWQVRAEQIVWVSGVQTWKRLARRGVWVNGSAESLGEHEPQRIETIAGSDLKWQKLTHSESDTESSMPVVATYRLIPKDGNPDLTGKNYFFWKSGSSFKYALSRNPWLREMTHFCGPGNTQRALQKQGIEPLVFLDHAQWLEEMSL
jgi:hydroxymethylbilane synthase